MEITKFNGLRNTVASERLKPGDLEVAKDVDIDGAGAIRTRLGMTSVSATASHSMWAKNALCLVAQSNVLKRMAPDGTLTSLAVLASAAPISYAESNGVVYFSNGTDSGRVVEGTVKTWGVRAPRGQPVATATAGGLTPGTYRYAMTFVRSDGVESGTPVPAQIDLPSGGGIVFSGMDTSSNSDVVGRVIYLSGPNGTELYRAGVATMLATTYSFLNAPTSLGYPLDTAGGLVEHAPPGTMVEVYAGCAYVVDGSVAWYSDQYQLERFRRESRFLQFPGPITLFKAVDDGIFVATDKETWFLPGGDATSLKSNRVLEVGAIPGTVAQVDSAELDNDDDERKTAPSRPALFWMSTDGVILGRSGGQVEKLTMDDYGIPPGVSGTGIVRAARGYVSYLASIRGSAASGNQH